MILAPLGALSKKPPLQTKLSGGSMSQIPNLEIKSVFQKEVLGNWGKMFTGTVLKHFEIALCTGNETLFQDTLSDFLLNSVSCLDTAQENFYHGMVLGMLSMFSDAYIITSNREAGEGRFDIQLEPRDKSKPGYLLEFKNSKLNRKILLIS